MDSYNDIYGGEIARWKIAVSVGVVVACFVIVTLVLFFTQKRNKDTNNNPSETKKNNNPNSNSALTTQKTITWYKVDDYPEVRTNNADWYNKLFARDYNMTCPNDSYIIQGKSHNGSFITNFGIKCSDNSTYSYNNIPYTDLGGSTHNFANGTASTRYFVGTPGGQKAVTGIFNPTNGKVFQCPVGTKIVGMKGKAGDYVGNLEFGCR